MALRRGTRSSCSPSERGSACSQDSSGFMTHRDRSRLGAWMVLGVYGGQGGISREQFKRNCFVSQVFILCSIWLSSTGSGLSDSVSLLRARDPTPQINIAWCHLIKRREEKVGTCLNTAPAYVILHQSTASTWNWESRHNQSLIQEVLLPLT